MRETIEPISRNKCWHAHGAPSSCRLLNPLRRRLVTVTCCHRSQLSLPIACFRTQKPSWQDRWFDRGSYYSPGQEEVFHFPLCWSTFQLPLPFHFQLWPFQLPLP